MKKIFTLTLLSLFTYNFLTAQIVITELYYNMDGYDDLDFVEFYNNSVVDIQMEGYYIGDGFEFTFPTYNLEAGTYMVITIDAPTLLDEFGIVGLQWDSGSLSSSGEDVSLYSPDSLLVDYVDYEDDSDGWSLLADARGVSLSLCDVDSDNEDPANWQVTSEGLGSSLGRTLIYTTPGVAANCASGPIVACSRYRHDLIENDLTDTINLFFYLTNPNGMPASLEIAVDPVSTASPDEYQLLESTINFDGMNDSVIIVRVVPGADDAIEEDVESLILNVTATNNVDRLLTETIDIKVYDDDLTSSESLTIAGVFNAAINNGGDEFGVELYALKDIPDLSVFGIGTANNGGGTDGIEIPLPAVSLSAGDIYFVADSDVRFTNFFGFAPDYTFASIWVTGNDAIQLYENGIVIDTYGEIDVDGEGSAWEYTEGWAIRNFETLPDGSAYVPSNWIYSGIEVLLGGAINDDCISPYPFGFYFPPTSVVEDLEASLNLQLSPNPVENILQIEFDNTNGIEIIDAIIYSVEGKIMTKTKIPNGSSNIQLDVTDLSSGIYIITFKASSGEVTQKFVK